MKDWDDLRYFLAVAEHGALAPAARELGVNHSTVFRRINAFEERLATRIFDRLPEGYHLTADGEAMLEEARRVQDAVHEIERRVAGTDVRLAGPIRLTAPMNLAVDYLPSPIARFAEQYPEIILEIAVSDTDFDLSRREADLALRATPSPPEHLIGRKITDLPWFAVAAPSYLDRLGQPGTVEELGEHRLIGADRAFSRLPVFDWLRRRCPDTAIRFRADNLSTMAAMARAGLGIALLPSDQDDPALRRLFSVCPEATSQLWLLTHPDLRRTARVRALMAFLFRELSADPRLAAPA